MTTMLLGIISCQDKAEAEVISAYLLKKHLAACIQIIDNVESSFLWPQGKKQINSANEALLLIKTLESKWDLLEKEIAKIHSYQNPEILALPVSHASKKYITWMTNELS